MKKIIVLFILFVATNSFAQMNGISYQAIILNPKGEQLPGVNNLNSPLVNKDICMVFKFVDEFSNVEYQETIQTKTDGFGMVNLVIGSGNQTAGYAASFKDIVWNISKKSLIVGINTDGSCTTYIEISNQDFSYVPLAFSAISAENVTGVVAIENGGTNATNLVDARTNLQISNVDNTTDLNKPISIATQSALNLKENTINKSIDVEVDQNSDVKYPSVKSVKMYVDGKLLVLSNAIDAEINRATISENKIASDLLVEVNNLVNNDNVLQSNIDVVQSDVDANETASNTANTTLQSNIDTVQSDVDANELASNTADTTLQSNIDAVQFDVDANETASNVANTTLQSNIDTVQSDVDTNETASNTADTTLQSNIDAVQSDIDANEASSQAADLVLQNNIDTNKTDANTAIAAVQSDVDANELASNIADTTLQSNIEAVQSDVDANELASNIADTTLQSNIEAVQSDVDANELASNAADTALQSNIDTVQSDVDANELASNTANATLQSNIGAVQSDVDANELTANNALGLKVDKVSGKGLSTEDYTSAEKSKLADITGTNTGDQDLSNYVTNTALNLKANLVSPAFTGIPVAPNATAGTNTTQVATTAFVNDAFTGKFMDLTTNQIIEGEKTFSSDISANGIKISQGGGKIGIGTVNPNQESSLEIATALPVILPLMSQNQIDVMTNPTVGMVQYNKTENKLQVYSTDGSSNLSTVFGNSATSSGATCLTSGELWFRPSVSGTITQIELSAFGAGETASLVLKSDFSCGSPAVLGTSNSITCIDGWNTWTFTTPVQVTAGTTYYITSNDANRCLGVRWANGDDVTTGSVDEDMFSPSGGCSLSNSDPASRITVVSSSSNSNWVNLIDGSHTSMINLATEVTDVLSVSNGGTGGTTSTGSGAVVLEFSPSLTGTPTAPTATAGTNTTQIATTAFVTNAISNAIIEVADEFSAAASQTSFTLTQTPSTNSKVKMYINGIRISKTAYSVSGTTLTYNSANNGSYTLSEGDRIQFDYFY